MFRRESGFSSNKDPSKMPVFLNIAGNHAVSLFNSFNMLDSEQSNYNLTIKSCHNYCLLDKNR